LIKNELVSVHEKRREGDRWMYKLTKRGIAVLAGVVAVGVISIAMGTFYLAVFGFIFCTFFLGTLIYDVFLNK
jgi:hypothetical protein